MKKVVIVGGGIAGLSAGVYAAQCGFDTTIYEMHSIAGGNCTSWKRGGYLFEGGMHWLTGSSKKDPLYKVWRNIGALEKDTKITYADTHLVYDHEGTEVKLYCDADKLEKHLLELSPEDKEPIKRLCKDMRLLGKMSMPVTDIKGLKTARKSSIPLSLILSMIPALPRMTALGKMSCKEYAEQFKHKGIQNALRLAMDDDFYAGALLVTLGSKADKAGFPEGGSLPFVGRIAKRFKSLGGKIQFNTNVERVVVENGRAVGVIVGGQRINADAVIVTLDTMVADRLFEKPLKADWMQAMHKNTIPVTNSFVSIGVNADLSDLPHTYGFIPDVSFMQAGEKVKFVSVNNYANIPGYSPKGKTSLTANFMGGDTYDYWKKAKEQGCYEEEKKKLADAVVAAITKKIPRIEGKVEVVDVATPLTYERYCGTWKGSWMTYMPKNTKQAMYPSKVDNVENCYFAGQRLTAPGGLPVALYSGRAAVQYLCRDTDTVFTGEAAE